MNVFYSLAHGSHNYSIEYEINGSFLEPTWHALAASNPSRRPCWMKYQHLSQRDSRTTYYSTISVSTSWSLDHAKFHESINQILPRKTHLTLTRLLEMPRGTVLCCARDSIVRKASSDLFIIFYRSPPTLTEKQATQPIVISFKSQK